MRRLILIAPKTENDGNAVRKAANRRAMAWRLGGQPGIERPHAIRGASLARSTAAFIASILMSVATFLAQASMSSPAGHRESPADEVVRPLQNALADAFNAGDVATVMSQYDPSIIVVAGSQTWDFVGQEQFIETAMAKPDRGRLRLEISYARELDRDCILARGRFHLMHKNAAEDTALFTVVYQRKHGDWKIIYAHSS